MTRSDLELELMLSTDNLKESEVTTHYGITVSTIHRHNSQKRRFQGFLEV